MSLLSHLKQNDSYHFGPQILKNGRKVPYLVYFSEIIDPKIGDIIYERALSKIKELPQSEYHIIGIENSGITLAKILFNAAKKCMPEVSFSTIDPHTISDCTTIIEKKEKKIILVDNAVTTGKTIYYVSSLLKTQDQITVFRFFDREEYEVDGSCNVAKMKAQNINGDYPLVASSL